MLYFEYEYTAVSSHYHRLYYAYQDKQSLTHLHFMLIHATTLRIDL